MCIAFFIFFAFIIYGHFFQVLEVGATFAIFSWEFDKREIGKIDTKIRGEFMGFKIQFWEENLREYTIREQDIGPDSAENTTGNVFTVKNYCRLNTCFIYSYS